MKTVNNQSLSDDSKTSSSKVLFWVFTVIASIICALIVMTGFSMWIFIAVGLWAWFLRSVWNKTKIGALVIGKSVVIGIVLIIVSLFFLSATSKKDMHKTEDVETKQESVKTQQATKEVDKISQFLLSLQQETDIDFEQVEDAAKIVWTNGGPGLGLQDGKKIKTVDTSTKSWKLIKQYFEDRDGTHGTVGMVFVNEGADNQDGYYFQGGEYKMLMCVLTQSNEETNVSCGWGPGGGK